MIPAAVAIAGCLIAGDSLAVGIGSRFPACVVSARIGAPTSAMPSMMPDGPWTIAILSAGSNDARAPDLQARLRRLRSRVHSVKVVWILPYDRRAATAVSMIAVERGDLVVDAAAYPTRDGVHPSDYDRIAAALR